MLGGMGSSDGMLNIQAEAVLAQHSLEQSAILVQYCRINLPSICLCCIATCMESMMRPACHFPYTTSLLYSSVTDIQIVQATTTWPACSPSQCGPSPHHSIHK